MVLLSNPSPPIPVATSHWALVMQTRLNEMRDNGVWFTDGDSPSCLAHVDSKGRIQLATWADDPKSAVAVKLAVEAAGALIEARQNITFAALDRRLLQPLTAALAAKEYERTWHSPCGLYRATGAASPITATSTMRPLRESDAPLVNDRWTYKSETTLEERVIPMIRSGVGCVGVESESGVLCGWVLRYQDGPLGMLWVEEAHRRKGYARRLIERARADLEAQGRPCFCYIVDGNVASETLFKGAGWERVADADWVGFAARNL